MSPLSQILGRPDQHEGSLIRLPRTAPIDQEMGFLIQLGISCKPILPNILPNTQSIITGYPKVQYPKTRQLTQKRFR